MNTSGLYSELEKLRELVAVAHSALALPAPGLEMQAYDRLLGVRARAVRAALHSVQEALDTDDSAAQIAGCIAYLRQAIAETPVDYATGRRGGDR